MPAISLIEELIEQNGIRMTTTETQKFKQTYATRIEAFREFIKPQELPVGKSQFYIDCDELGIGIAKKPVQLCDLLNYAHEKLNVNGVTMKVIKDTELDTRKSQLEVEKLEMDVEKRRRELDRESDKYMLKDDHNGQQAALVGVLRSALTHQFHTNQGAITLAAGGQQKQSPQVFESCESAADLAFNEVAGYSEIDVEFEDDLDDLDPANEAEAI